jgi:hypothetical protein
MKDGFQPVTCRGDGVRFSPEQLSRKPRFASLRQALIIHEIAHLRVVYCALAGARLVTLCAIPRIPDTGPVTLPSSLTSKLLRAFLKWMAHSYPEWWEGEESVGTLDWKVDTSEFIHRHGGYQVRYFSEHRRGGMGGDIRTAHIP